VTISARASPACRYLKGLVPRPPLAPGLQPARLPDAEEQQTVYGTLTIRGCCMVLECSTPPGKASTEWHRGARNSYSVLRLSIFCPGSTTEAGTQIVDRLPVHILPWSLLSPSSRAKHLMEDVHNILPLFSPWCIRKPAREPGRGETARSSSGTGTSINTLVMKQSTFGCSCRVHTCQPAHTKINFPAMLFLRLAATESHK